MLRRGGGGGECHELGSCRASFIVTALDPTPQWQRGEAEPRVRRSGGEEGRRGEEERRKEDR